MFPLRASSRLMNVFPLGLFHHVYFSHETRSSRRAGTVVFSLPTAYPVPGQGLAVRMEQNPC